MHSEALLKLAQSSLEDLKARDIRVLDVRSLTTVTNFLLIASGTSVRHVKSMADQLIENAKLAGQSPWASRARKRVNGYLSTLQMWLCT